MTEDVSHIKTNIETITPLAGNILVTSAKKPKSIDSEISEAYGLDFITVDETARRNDVQNNCTRVRLFNLEAVSDFATAEMKSLVGKKVFCVCMENENMNNVIVDSENGNKIFVLPETSILAILKN